MSTSSLSSSLRLGSRCYLKYHEYAQALLSIRTVVPFVVVPVVLPVPLNTLVEGLPFPPCKSRSHYFHFFHVSGTLVFTEVLAAAADAVDEPMAT